MPAIKSKCCTFAINNTGPGLCSRQAQHSVSIQLDTVAPRCFATGQSDTCVERVRYCTSPRTRCRTDDTSVQQHPTNDAAARTTYQEVYLGVVNCDAVYLSSFHG